MIRRTEQQGEEDRANAAMSRPAIQIGRSSASELSCRRPWPSPADLRAARPASRSAPSAGRHQQADLLPLGGRAVDEGDDLAAVHHGDPIGQLQDLVELGRHEQDGRPRVALGDDLLVDELDAADVEAAGRLVEHQEPKLAAELAGDDDLLLVAAGQRRRPGPSADGVRMSNSVDRPRRPIPRSRRRCGRSPRANGRFVVLRQDEVVRRAGTPARARTAGGRRGRSRQPALAGRSRASGR